MRIKTMKSKIAAAVIAVILFAVVFKAIGDSDLITIEDTVSRAQHTATQYSYSPPAGADSSVSFSIPAQTASQGSPFKYYYYRLSETERKAYDNILSAIYDMPERIRVPSLKQDELNNTFEALLYDNPDLFFVSTKCTQISIGSLAYMSMEYRMSKSEYKAGLAKINAACDRIVSSLTAPRDEWRTELEIHNALIDTLEYKFTNEPNDYSTVYGALINGEASCEGYSKAAKYLFDRLGIESYVVAGRATDSDGTSEAHMWNIVRVNGDYCQLDITWDDPIKSDYRTYAYFNLTDEQINYDHGSWHFDYDCASASQSYYVANGLYYTSYSSADNEALAQAVAKQIDGGADVFELRFSSASAYNMARRALIDEQNIYEVLYKAKKYGSVKNYSHTSLTYAESDSTYMMTFFLNFE
ncbi:MAG: hypothetical protein IJK60_03325 [Clostridia bacterium]|nr:hypothetical protein [Clostridia bacterium]